MGKPERRMQRVAGVNKPTSLHSEALKHLQDLPKLMQGIIDANKVLTEEQARLKGVIGDILQDHANQLANLNRRLGELEGTNE